jgi:8-oxo-dGTP pyrophosphatase MutT (NUDIX family)
MVNDPRQEILGLLQKYKTFWFQELNNPIGEDPEIPGKFESFVQSHENCFSRELLIGHITGSALIVNEAMDSVLLTHHRKLNLWLQLGGHADGNPHPHEVALTEGREESGLSNLRFFDHSKVPAITDLDIHSIPARPGEPEHLHYDVRYIVIAAEGGKIEISDESHDLRWFPIEEAYAIANQWSMHRQFDKVSFLKNRSLS